MMMKKIIKTKTKSYFILDKVELGFLILFSIMVGVMISPFLIGFVGKILKIICPGVSFN